VPWFKVKVKFYQNLTITEIIIDTDVEREGYMCRFTKTAVHYGKPEQPENIGWNLGLVFASKRDLFKMSSHLICNMDPNFINMVCHKVPKI
jgi:hypothetical protein